MGIEQDKPVADSSIELPHNIDLPDLRLPRAFTAWTNFKTNHQPQITAIGILPLEQVIALGDELSISVSQAIGMESVTDQPRGIDKEKILVLSKYFSGGGNRTVFMRHGEQSPPEWVYSIPNPALRKIRMMQNPFNREDLLTNGGLVEVFLSALSLLYLKDSTGRKVHILSSENSRAKEVGEIFSTVIPDATFFIHEGLSCIIYRDERDQPPVNIEDLLTKLPSGMMPWDPNLVDRWCKRTRSGLRQSQMITNTVKDLVEANKGEGNSLYMVLTHTQQLAEVLRLVGRLEDPFIRFPELSMIVLRNRGDLIILPKSVIYEAADKI